MNEMNDKSLEPEPKTNAAAADTMFASGAFRAAICLPSLYITIAILSNISSLRIVTVMGASMDAGTLLYPFSFTIRDLIHKFLGAAAARTTILAATALNALAFGVFWLVARLPADAQVGPQTEFGIVLLPGARIVLGSTVAMCVAELLDTEIYSMVHRRFGERHKWLRVALSNLISIPVDTVVMTAIAFVGRYPMSVLIEITIINIVIKYVVTAISIHWIYFGKEDRA